MRVELTTEIFTTHDHVERVLTLIRHFRTGRHDWVVDPAAVSVIRPYLHDNVRNLAPVYAELAEACAVRAAYAAADRRTTVRITPKDIDDTVEDLEHPAYVAVEDDHSDGCFLRAIATVFGARRILCALEKGWLVPDHGGGQGGAVRRARLLRDRFRCLSRVVVLIDSDRMMPGSWVKKSHQPAEELKRDGIRTHVLALREAENYVPNRILAGIGRADRSSRRLDLLKQLSSEQRGHFDIKDGFRKGVIPDDQIALYSDLTPQVIAGLDGGFGKRVLEGFATWAGALSEADFRELGPTVVSELQSILAMLDEIV